MKTQTPSSPTAARTLPNYVGGAWVDAAGDDVLNDLNPATGELLARIPLSGAADVDAAVRAARAAQPAWRETAPQVRARALYRLRDVLDAHREELATLVTRDMGKTIDDARGEVGRGIESVEAAMAAPHLLKGQNLEGVARGLDVELVRQPVGVVAAITPFNFPAMIPLWFLPFALACGNAFILKPSERDPLTSERIVELIASIPDPGRPRQPRPRWARGGRRDPRPPGHRRDLVRRLRHDRALRQLAWRRARQARAGARRREELDGRDARRRSEAARRRRQRLRLWGRRPALSRRLDRRARRHARAAGSLARRARGGGARLAHRCRHRPGDGRLPARERGGARAPRGGDRQR